MKYEPVYQNYFYPKKRKARRKTAGGRARFEITFDDEIDKDILRKLDRQPNKSDYIRELIRNDIKKRGN